MNIGNRIKEERERLGFNQEKFAEIGGVSRRSQVMYEQNKTDASAGYFTKISEIGADVNYVLTGKRSKQEVAANNEDSFSSEDLQLLRLIKLLAPEQKNETVEDIRKTTQRNQSVVSHWVASNQGRHHAAMA